MIGDFSGPMGTLICGYEYTKSIIPNFANQWESMDPFSESIDPLLISMGTLAAPVGSLRHPLETPSNTCGCKRNTLLEERESKFKCLSSLNSK